MPSRLDVGSTSIQPRLASGDSSLAHQLERLRQGDSSSLGPLYLQFGDTVYRTALRLTASRPDAEDVTQELFLRLPTAIGGFTGDAGAFPGWIRRVAVRQALVLLRSWRRRREVGVETISSLLAPSDAGADRLTMEAALARLPIEQRHVFVLKEVEGYAHGEIAELLGITTAASEVRLHRARRALRELLRGSR